MIEEDRVQYRFRWTLLGEAELILPNDASRYCAFSRAALKFVLPSLFVVTDS